MPEIYDLTIIGAGPAGISAAIYASRARLHTLWLEKKFAQGGQIINTYEVDNYPGIPEISGMELGEAMASHADRLGISPVKENVLSVEDKGKIKIVRTKKNAYQSRTVIFALGAEHRTLGIPGEEELSGMGVSYCATCDGAFYKDAAAAVVGGGNTAVEDALFLSRICRKVYLIHRREKLRADRILQERLNACGNVDILWNTVPVAVEGQDEVTGLKIRNVKAEEEQLLPVDGVFIAVGVVPNTEKLKELMDTDENGYIIAGEDCVTSAPGLFAAGDLRTKPLRQVITAVADGANAVISVQRYLLQNS